MMDYCELYRDWDDITVITRRYGSHVMQVIYTQGEPLARVHVDDLGRLRFTCLWSAFMTRDQARAALHLFEDIGYYDMPIGL